MVPQHKPFCKIFFKSLNIYTGLLQSEVWQVRRVSNPQPAVLETAALPIELLTCLIKFIDYVLNILHSPWKRHMEELLFSLADYRHCFVSAIFLPR
jgi:hypothetical protein